MVWHRKSNGGSNKCGGIQMEPLITAAARALEAGDPFGAVGRVALRDDAPALALRRIAMVQHGHFPERDPMSAGPEWVTTSLSKPPHDRSAVRPEADTLNRPVRSLFTSPERRFFKPDPLRAPSNPLNYRAFNIRTKMAVVRLLRRKWAERDEKRPEVGPQAGPHGSDNLPGMAAVCGFPTADQERKKNVPTWASWRSERNCGQTLSALDFKELE